MNKPIVSIVTPSYNQGQYLEDCILSVKNQTYKNIEHIIVDACSTDNSEEIILKHHKDYNLRFLIEADKGPADALNKGFALAKGDYFCWLNSDDFYLHRDVIQIVVDYFYRYRESDVISGCGYLVDSKGGWIAPRVIKLERVTLHHLRFEDSMLQPSTFWKKEAHVQLNEKYAYVFDWLLFLEMFQNGAKVLSIYDYLSAYRLHEKSRTTQDNAARKMEIAQILRLNFSILSIQYVWAIYIYMLYKLAEVTNIKLLKKIAKISNYYMYSLSFGKVGSA